MFSGPSQELYYTIEEIVRAWAGGALNYGLGIAAHGDSGGTSNYREFLSKEWAEIDGRGPVRFVSYEAPLQCHLSLDSPTTEKNLTRRPPEKPKRS
jgi:hypothetical protein